MVLNFVFIFLVCLLSSCTNHSKGVNHSKDLHGKYKIGNSYAIGDKIYTPQEYTSFQEEGYISWYGSEFHGKKTANGATFNKNTHTAAHRTLPMPSVIEITNLENGKKLIAVVNDRGPFSKSQHRILDVSEKVAKELGFVKQGIVRARVKLLTQETQDLTKRGNMKIVFSRKRKLATDVSEKVSENNALEGKYIQIGAFKDKKNVDQISEHLQNTGFDSIQIFSKEIQNGKSLSIIRIGPIKDGFEENILTKIKKLGYDKSVIITLQ